MFGDLGGRVAVVTGGTGGMGTGVVEVLAGAGARVVVPWNVHVELEPFRTAMDRAGVLERVDLREVDVTDAASVEAFFQEVRGAEGRMDILVNGVGAFTMASLSDTSRTTWDRMMTLNATTALMCSRAAVAVMGEAGGRIVNVSAMPAVTRGAAGMSAYAASKAAVLSLTESLAKELRSRRITVNAILPTTIDTPGNRAAMPDADRSAWLAPLDIGQVVRFLVSDEGGIVTGAAVTLGR